MRHIVLCVLGIAILSTPAGAQTDIPPELEALRTPRITTRPAEMMLVVEAVGDPRTVGGQAFGLLFQLYYGSPLTPKGPDQPAPRARWPVDFDQPRSEWLGIYALPVPEEFDSLPVHTAPPGLEAMLTTWEYGSVVEVLHVGPYDREEPTLRRLREWALAEGYELAGPHEEEYIRGPTMAGPGDPEQYLTILRYRVAAIEELTLEVRSAEIAFAATMAERDLESFLAFVADEAVFVSGQSVLRGVAAVREGWSPFFDGPSAPFSWEPELVEVLESGTLALSTGPVRSANGRLVGTFNSIWRRDAEGHWKVVFDKGCPVCDSGSQ